MFKHQIYSFYLKTIENIPKPVKVSVCAFIRLAFDRQMVTFAAVL